jgi:hypothetical protein
MERVESGEGHGGAPAGAVVPRPLGAIGRDNEPPLAQRLPDIEMDIAAVLALEITRRKNYQDRPVLFRIESGRHSQDRDGARRDLIATDRREGFLFGAEGHGDRDCFARLDCNPLKQWFLRGYVRRKDEDRQRDEGR